MTTRARARIGDVLAVAAWSGLAFGFCEGLLLEVARAWPTLLAPYKASSHLLWLSPLFDVVVFSFAGLGLWVAMNWLGAWLRGQALRTAVSFFSAAGTATVGVTLNVLHPASVAVFAAGVGVATWRAVAGRESALIAAMRRRVWLIPIAIVVIALGVEGYMRLSEALRYAALPPVGPGA